jgi:hypothetical protein
MRVGAKMRSDSGWERESGKLERSLVPDLGTGTGTDLEDGGGVAGGTIGLVVAVVVTAPLGWRRLASLPDGWSVRVGGPVLRGEGEEGLMVVFWSASE